MATPVAEQTRSGRRRQTKVATSRRRHRKAWVPYAFIAPALLTYLTIAGLGFVHAAWLSFFEWDGITIGTWTGFDNYRAILSDDVIRSSFVHAGILVLFYCIPVVIGLVIASMFRTVAKRGGTFFRGAIFLPQVLAGAVIGVIWTWIYAINGSLNEFLRTIGLGALAQPWLGDFTWALPAIGMIGAWWGLGWCMVVFVAGIQQIDSGLYDAARVDGAGRIAEFFAVTLPSLRYELGVVLTFTVVGALQVFDIVFVTTRGGPGTSTQVPGIQIYQRTFLDGRVGQACAIAVVLAILVFIVTVVIDRIASKENE